MKDGAGLKNRGNSCYMNASGPPLPFQGYLINRPINAFNIISLIILQCAAPPFLKPYSTQRSVQSAVLGAVSYVYIPCVHTYTLVCGVVLTVSSLNQRPHSLWHYDKCLVHCRQLGKNM